MGTLGVLFVPLRGTMTAHDDDGLADRRRIAARLGLTETDGKPGQFEGRCPECGRGGFSIARADKPVYRHVWNCGGKQRRHTPEVIRAAMLRKDIPAAWLGRYGLNLEPAADPIAVAELREAVDLILSWPGMDAAKMRLTLAEARGDKIPEDYREFARFAQEIGVGRRHSYNLAAEHCRPPDSPRSGGGEVQDQS